MRKLFLDFFPILVFFITFKLVNIYWATGMLMIASTIQIGYVWLRTGSVEIMHVITLVLVLLFGGLTLYFHNDRFIQWKVTILNWLFAILFAASQWFMRKPLVQWLMGSTLKASRKVWRRLNMAWVVYFTLLGALNLYIAYTFSLSTWVNFKLFGLLACTLVFVIGQSLWLYRHIEH